MWLKEALEHVHKALEQKAIIFVNFSWAQYCMVWLHSGPGYYAGINIATNGEWPSVVARHATVLIANVTVLTVIPYSITT